MSDKPADLQTTPQPDTDKDYFNFKAAGLKINRPYAIKFQWIYPDGTVSEWSSGFILTTSNETSPAVPTSVTIPETSTGSIPVTLSVFPTNAKRVDVIITGGVFGTSKVAHSFTTAGVATIAAPAGFYTVQLRSISPSGVTSTVGTSFTITVADVGETIQAPTNPNGFSIDRILAGIQVNWAGTYANGTFTGFEAIKIYVGNTALATSGTYREAGVMTGNNVKNTITIPVDGTYLRYNQPVYIHAAAVNKSGTVGTIQANVANDLLGARSAVSADLADEIITNAKLVADSVTATKIALGAITEVKIDTGAITAAKIAAGAVTETKIADNAISSPKIVAGAIDAGKIAAGAVTTEKLDALAITADKIAANAITSDKIVANAITAGKIDALAITADKIAADAITATKIKAGEIGVLKLAAGTISVNNLEAGTIASTSYIRAGSKNISTGLGARVEISSAAIEDGTVDIAPGFYIYNSAGTAVLSAPLNGGLSIVGGGSFTGDISAASGQFDGDLGASGGNFRVRSGTVTALAGQIGNWIINESAFKSSAVAFPNIELDPVEAKIHLRASAGSSEVGNFIKMDTTAGLRVGSGSSPSFSVAMDGSLTASNATISKSSGSNTIILDNSGFRAIGTDGTVTIGYDGNVTLQSSGNSFGATEGSIITLTGTATSGFEGEPPTVTSTTVGPGSFSLYQGSVFGSAAFSFYQYVSNNQLNYYATGLSEITWRNYYTNPSSPTYNYASSRVSTATSGDAFRPLGITPFGGQYMGQRLFSGTATSNTAINNDINNRTIANLSLNGDFYFSTA
jgi:hypothetical protein